MGNPRILAAGGILWRDAERSRLAVIHRVRYGDWALPKGKLEEDETFLMAARREVLEETGWQSDVGEFAGEVYYRVGDRPKSVLFWNMTARGDGPVDVPDADEVASVVWLPVADALEKLSYQDERDLVREHARVPS